MKKINYYLGALALATLGMTSCSSDDITPNDLERTDIERQVYVNVSIHGNNAGSRSSSSNGTPDDADFAASATGESTVKDVYLVFYDAVGNVVGDVVTANPTWGTANADGNNVEQVGTETIQVTLAVGQQQPSFVMCYINSTGLANLKQPLNQLATTTIAVVQNPEATGGTFPMSNSVYFDASGNAVTATSIAGKYYATRELAEQAAATGASVDIYVERYAAKLQLNTIPTVTPYQTGTMTLAGLQGTEGTEDTKKMLDVVLTFEKKGWEVNGVAENTYAIKSFRKESDNGQVLTEEYSFAEMNNRINGTYSVVNGVITLGGDVLSGTAAWDWNSTTNSRSYWACSPVYFQSNYPEVGSDYNAADMAQKFFTYKDVLESNKGYDTPYYFPETTVGARGLYSANPNAAVASVILVGQYNMTVDGTAVPEGTTFYTYVPVNIEVTEGKTEQHPSVYFEVKKTNQADDVTGASEVDGTLSMRNRFLWQNSVLYKKVGDSFVRYNMAESPDVNTLVAATNVARPDDKVLAMAVVGNAAVKMADRTRTLQITGNFEGIYINDNGVVKEIVANDATPTANQITLDRANLILWQNVGTCNKYDGGAAFYNIPVKHLGWYRQGNTQKNDPKIDFAKVRVGDLGMVRNHSYTMQINSIVGLAPGIGGQDDPIIPPAETQDVYVSYRVNVLEWAVVPTQQVNL